MKQTKNAPYLKIYLEHIHFFHTKTSLVILEATKIAYDAYSYYINCFGNDFTITFIKIYMGKFSAFILTITSKREKRYRTVSKRKTVTTQKGTK